MKLHTRFRVAVIICCLIAVFVLMYICEVDNLYLSYSTQDVQLYSTVKTPNISNKILKSDGIFTGLLSENISLLFTKNGKKNVLQLSNTGLLTFDTRKLHTLSMEEPYLSWRANMRERCTKEETTSRYIDLKRMVYDDRHKVVMCVVPKNACSTWKRHLWYLMGRVKDKSKIYSVANGVFDLSSGHLPTMNRLTKEQALERLLTYTTFFVRRNPLQRLVSAHSSKFTDRTKAQNTYKIKLGRPIALQLSRYFMHGMHQELRLIVKKRMTVDRLKRMEIFQQLSDGEKMNVLNYVNMTLSGAINFPLFTRFIALRSQANPSSRTMDVHWRPQVDHCNPCALNYDYVIDFDNLVRDSNRLLRYLQRDDSPDNVALLEEGTSSLIDAAATQEKLRLIDSATRAKILNLYARDAHILGYEHDLSHLDEKTGENTNVSLHGMPT